MDSEDRTFGAWKKLDSAPGNEEPVLLWYDGATAPVFGHTYRYADGKVGASSAMARGVKFTHWMPMPEGPSEHQ